MAKGKEHCMGYLVTKDCRMNPEECKFLRQTVQFREYKNISIGYIMTYVHNTGNFSRKYLPIVPSGWFPGRKTQAGRQAGTLCGHGLVSRYTVCSWTGLQQSYRTKLRILPKPQQFPPPCLACLSKVACPHPRIASVESDCGKNPIPTWFTHSVSCLF